MKIPTHMLSKLLDNYDLKCRINLSEVPSGKYIVSEYYIANKHNYRNIKINID